MPRIRHTSGPGRFGHSALSGVSGRGDEHDVSEEAAAYLCDDLGYFERNDVIDAEHEVVDEESKGDGGEDAFDLDEFLDQNAKPAAEDIRAGEVDDHLDAIAEAGDRTTVQDAVDERRADLE